MPSDGETTLSASADHVYATATVKTTRTSKLEWAMMSDAGRFKTLDTIGGEYSDGETCR